MAMATTATKNITYDEGRDEVDWWRETWRLNIIAALQKKATPSSAAPVLRLLHRWLALIGVPFWASTSQPARRPRRPRRAAPCRSRRASLFLCLFLDRGGLLGGSVGDLDFEPPRCALARSGLFLESCDTFRDFEFDIWLKIEPPRRN